MYVMIPEEQEKVQGGCWVKVCVCILMTSILDFIRYVL
jgi:hypothetical protein